MKQMTIFEAIEDKPDKIGLLYRCHLYHNDELKYTAFPSLKGMKLIGIRTADVFNLTVEEYEQFKADEGLREVEQNVPRT